MIMNNRRLLKNELNRAVFNVGMMLSIAISTVLVFLFCKDYLGLWNEVEIPEGFYEPLRGGTPLSGWIISVPSPQIFYLYYLISFLAILPYGMSFLTDIRSGVIKNIMVRVKRSKYATYKFFATFVSGGIALVMPLAISLLINLSFVPIQMVKPEVLPLQGITWLEKLLYTQPLLYILIYMCLYFMLGGILACLSFLIATVSRNRLTVFLTPFFIMLLILFIQQRLMIMGAGSNIIKYFPYTFMFGFSIRGGMEIILGGLFAISIVEYTVFRYRVCKMEVM